MAPGPRTHAPGVAGDAPVPGAATIPAGQYYAPIDIQLAPASTGRMSRAPAASLAQNQAAATASLIEQIVSPAADSDTSESFQPNGLTFDTNGLWLENLNLDPTNIWLRLHHTVENENYQLLSTTNLSSTNWDIGQLWGPADASEEDADPIPMTNRATFFRVQHAMPIMALYDDRDSEELNPTNAGNLVLFMGWI